MNSDDSPEIQLPIDPEIFVSEEEDFEFEEPPVSPEDLAQARLDIVSRCKAAGLPVEEKADIDGTPYVRFGIKCGRDHRLLTLPRDKHLLALRSIEFEKFVFLSDYSAICSYSNGYIEALVSPVGTGFLGRSMMLRRLFNQNFSSSNNIPIPTIDLVSNQQGFPRIEISK